MSDLTSYEQLDELEKYIDMLWVNVILPYIKDPNRKILLNLTENDKHKFYKFMLENTNVNLEEST